MSILGDLQNNCICNVDGLDGYLSLSDTEKERIGEIIKRYPLKVTPYYLGLIDKNDPADPIRKLCIPEYSEHTDDGEEDTSGEAQNTVVKGMQHKYSQTVLILSTNKCASYCRHCFRKRMVGYCGDEVADDLEKMASYVSSHKEINNVLISGGDAFANENSVIRDYLETFSALDNINLIRFGTRVPVVMPQRIYEDEEFLSILKEYGKKIQIAVVTQFNHPREITEEAKKAVRAVIECGAYVRNQSVLLKGVNDDPQILSDLMNKAVSAGAIPYYLFQCRPVLGVKNHFQVPLPAAAGIIRDARKLMNGQARGFRYVLSHPTGKIEMIGLMGEEMLFKYHEAKSDKDQGRLFCIRPDEKKCWLDDADIKQ
ncbi:MAG: KamA family radical SAM protein [Lachnospiraceae bacterium]|nr:KamA family radical SAM protein [Lachnospiraceae bacterium]